MAKGSFRFPLYTGGGTPDPTVFCPAEGYILPEDCPVPDPAVFCPTNGYIPDEPGAGTWELLFATKTNSPASTTFDPFFTVSPNVPGDYAIKVGDAIFYTNSLSEILDGTLKDVGVYRKVGSAVRLFNFSWRDDHLVGPIKMPVLGEAGNTSVCSVDLDGNPDITSVYFDDILSPMSNIWIRYTGITGTIDLSNLKVLSTNGALLFSSNPNLNHVILPSPSNPVTGNLKDFSVFSSPNVEGVIDLRAFTEIKNVGTSRPTFLFTNSKITSILFNSGVAVSEFKRIDISGTQFTGVFDISMINSWSPIKDGELQIYNCPKLTGIIFPASMTGGLKTLFASYCNLTGVIDLSVIFANVSDSAAFEFMGNPNLTGFIMPSTVTGKVWRFHAYKCNLTGHLDLSCIKELSASASAINLYENPNLTGVTFNPTITGLFSGFSIQKCNITGILDISMFTNFSTNAAINIGDNPNLTGIVLSPTNISVGSFRGEKCDLTGTLDLSKCTHLTYISLNENPLLTGVNFAASITGLSSYIYLHTCNLTGTLDLSTLGGVTAGCNIRIYNNPNLTGVLLPSGSNAIAHFHAYGCDLGYINFTVLPNMTSRASCLIYLENNNMTAAEVNQILHEINGLSVSGYTGRQIRIYGTNAAPDTSSGGYDGLAAKASLQSMGFLVTTSS